MKKILNYLFLIVITTLFVFSMSACDNNEPKGGKIGDLIADKTIERIDFFELTNSITETETGNEVQNSWHVMEQEGKLYSIPSSNINFDKIRDMFLNTVYTEFVYGNQTRAYQNSFVIFFTDKTYLVTSNFCEYYFIDSNGNLVSTPIYVVEPYQVYTLSVLLKYQNTATDYDSFEDYWATIAPNQFWVEN